MMLPKAERSSWRFSPCCCRRTSALYLVPASSSAHCSSLNWSGFKASYLLIAIPKPPCPRWQETVAEATSIVQAAVAMAGNRDMRVTELTLRRLELDQLEHLLY